MLKMIALLRRRPGMSFEDFVDHYENSHVPLIEDQQGPGLIGYSRRYRLPDGQVGGPDADVDVVTECVYPDRAAFDAAMARMMEPARARAREEDEAKFLDTALIRVFLVDERVSERVGS